MSYRINKKNNVVLTKEAWLSHHPPYPYLIPWCTCFVHAQNLFHNCIHKGKQDIRGKQKSRQRNRLSHTPLIYLL